MIQHSFQIDYFILLHFRTNRNTSFVIVDVTILKKLTTQKLLFFFFLDHRSNGLLKNSLNILHFLGRTLNVLECSNLLCHVLALTSVTICENFIVTLSSGRLTFSFVMGVSPALASLLVISLSSLRSILVPARTIGTFGQ